MGSIRCEIGPWGLGLKAGLRFVLAGLMLCAFSVPLHAQTWSEWFRQKKTEERYLAKQVAYLRLYAGYLKKGYEVASNGLGTIKGITSGEMGLHEAFFSSLKLVSPAVRGDPRVVEVAEMALRVGRMVRLLERAELGMEAEGYVLQVCAGLGSHMASDLEELLMVVTSGRLEMGDNERLLRLANVHRSMSEKLEFSVGFLEEVQLMEKARERERLELDRFRRMYGND